MRLPKKPDTDLRTASTYSLRHETMTDGSYILHVQVENPPLLSGTTYVILFDARTTGTAWTEPRTLHGQNTITWGETP